MTVWWCLTLGRPYSCDGFGSAIHGANTQAPDRPARPSMAGRSPSREPVVRKRDGSPLAAPEQQPLDVMPLQPQEQRQPRQDRHHRHGHPPPLVLPVLAPQRRPRPPPPPQVKMARQQDGKER